MELPNSEPAEVGPDAAMDAVDDASILSYFLMEVRKQDAVDWAAPTGPGRRGRRTVRMPSFADRAPVHSPQPKRRVVVPQQSEEAHTVSPFLHGQATGSALGNSKKSEWLTASLSTALKTSDSLSLVKHFQALASQLFNENANLKCQVQQGTRDQRHSRNGRSKAEESLQRDGASGRALDLAAESSQVPHSTELLRTKRALILALEDNRKLQQQRACDRQTMAELELKSRTFADAYAWLTSHNRMISARDASALVALWRKRVAESGAAGKGTLVPAFTKDLAAACAAAESEGDTEAASEDGVEKEGENSRLLAAKLREAEAVSEARQAQARADAAESLLAVTQAQLERIQKVARSSTSPQSTSTPSAEEEKLRAALKASQMRVTAAEAECVKLAEQVQAVQAALDASVVERQRIEAQTLELMSCASSKQNAKANVQASGGMQASGQQSNVLDEYRIEVEKLRKELEQSKKQCELLKADEKASDRRAGGKAQADGAPSRSTPVSPPSDVSTLISERDSYKAAALRLERDVEQLKAKADDVAKLENVVATLKGQLATAEDLKEAYEALQKEAEGLRSKLEAAESNENLRGPAVAECSDSAGDASQLHSVSVAALTEERNALKKRVHELEQNVAKLQAENDALKKQAAGSKQLPTRAPQPTDILSPVVYTDVSALIKERDSLVERVAGLEKEVALMRSAAKSSGSAPPTRKLPTADADFPTVQTSVEQRVEEPSEAGGQKRGPLKILGSPVGKKTPGLSPSKIGKSPCAKFDIASKASESSGGSPPSAATKDVPTKSSEAPVKDAKVGKAPLPKPAAKDTKVAAPPKKAQAVEALSARQEDSSAMARPETLAELEAELKALKLKAEAAEKLEQEVLTLREKLSAADDLRKANEALQTQLADLRKTLSDAEDKGKSASPSGGGKDEAASELSAGLAAVQKERDELKQRILDLEKELSALRDASEGHEKDEVAAKKSSTVKSLPGGPPPPGGKSPPPPPQPTKAAAAVSESVEVDQPAEDSKEAPAVKKLGAPVAKKVSLPPKTGKAPPPKESVAAKESESSSGSPTSVATKDVPTKSSEAPVKDAKVGKAPLPKFAAKDTKVAAPPKEAQAVGTLPASVEALSAEAKDKLEKEMEKLKGQLAAYEDLKRANLQLKEELNGLQKELQFLKAQSAAVDNVGSGQSIPALAGSSEALLEERNSLKERVTALEAELFLLRATGQQSAGKAVTASKGKAEPPVKAKPPPAETPLGRKSVAVKVDSSKPETGQAVDISLPKKDAASKSVSVLRSSKFISLDKESLLTQEVLSKSDAETEAGDTGDESNASEERVAALTERLQRAKRRVRNLVVKCNALLEMEKDRDVLRNKLEALQAEHDALSLKHVEAADKKAQGAKGLAAKGSMLKSASAADLPSSHSNLNVASTSTIDSEMSERSSSAVLNTAPSDLAAKYEQLKVQRDKLYATYKSQKERIVQLEQQEAEAKEKLEKMEHLYEATKEELEIYTRPKDEPEGGEGAGLFSWLGGGPNEHKTSSEEEKLRARLDLIQQRLDKTVEENETLRSQLKRLQNPPTKQDSIEAEMVSGEPGVPAETAPKHLQPGTAKTNSMGTKAPVKTKPPCLPSSTDKEAATNLDYLQNQIKDKDAQIKAYEAEILKLKAAHPDPVDNGSVNSELKKRTEELQAKEKELETAKMEAQEREKIIRDKTEEIMSLQTKLKTLEREKAQALDEVRLLKEKLAALEKELEQLRGMKKVTAARDGDSSRDDRVTPSGTVAKRSVTLVKRSPGPRSPVQKTRSTDSDGAAATPGKKAGGGVKEEEAYGSKAQATEAIGKPEKADAESVPESPVNSAQKKNKSAKKTEAEGNVSEKTGDKKKKKKKKDTSSDEWSGPTSERESVTSHEVGETTLVSPGGWGFGLFGGDSSAPAKPAESPSPREATNLPRPSLLDLIVGPEPVEEPPSKERELPPLKLSAVEGADEPSDDSSSEGEGEGGIASTIAGFFWAV